MELNKFIDEANKIHNNKYDYDLNELDIYTNREIYITCKKHGLTFRDKPGNHLNYIMKRCACKLHINNFDIAYMNYRSYSRDDYFALTNKLYNDKYTYNNKDEYKNLFSILTITCTKHDCVFKQQAHKHLRTINCKKCRTRVKVLNTKIFVDYANRLHCNKYDYSKTIFTDLNILVSVICKKHGAFLISPHAHIYGMNGCKKCKQEFYYDFFLAKAKQLYGDKYVYFHRNVMWFKPGYKTYVHCIVHNVYFNPIAYNHIYGNDKCKKCKQKLTLQDLINVMYKKYDIV